MSLLKKYSCPNCNKTLSGYSKKGIESFHTSVGIPLVICDKCQGDISMGHKPFSQMGFGRKSLEYIKTGLNILLKSIYIAVFVPFFLAMIVVGCESLTGVKPPNALTNLDSMYVISLWLIFLALIVIYKFRNYQQYYNWIEEQTNIGKQKITLEEFLDKYPDW